MPIEQLDSEAWMLIGHLDGQWSEMGGKTPSWGCVPTESQILTACAILSVYKLQRGDQSLVKDYFLIAGDVYHGIQGSPEDPSANWLSVGFFANFMRMHIHNGAPGARLQTFGPNSTSETATISFAVGGELSAGTEGAGGSANASVGVSFSASEVSFAARPTTNSIEWYTALPGVNWISPAVPPNPAEPSYAGYIWNPAVIFEMPQGKTPLLSGYLQVEFAYDFTRGIRHRDVTPVINLVYRRADGIPAEPEAEKTLPTIMERLRMLCASAESGGNGTTDTFLAALTQTGMAASFGDSNLEQLVIAPSNAVIAEYLKAHPAVAVAAAALANQRWLEDWVAERVISLPPKSAWPTVTSHFQTATGLSGDWYECADGLLLVSDSFELPDGVRTATNQLIVSSAA